MHHRGAVGENPHIISEMMLDLRKNSKSEVPSAALWVVVRGQIPEELEKELRRDFTEAELQRIYARIHKTLAPANSRPLALFIFGPSAVGKTILADAKAHELFGSPENAVEVDGAHFRAEHGGWQAVTQQGSSSGVLHQDAWEIFKKLGYSSRLKAKVIEDAISAQQHLIIPDTLNDPKKVDKLIEQLLQAKYALHAVCLCAHPPPTRPHPPNLAHPAAPAGLPPDPTSSPPTRPPSQPPSLPSTTGPGTPPRAYPPSQSRTTHPPTEPPPAVHLWLPPPRRRSSSHRAPPPARVAGRHD
jgi:hypothetical protein